MTSITKKEARALLEQWISNAQDELSAKDARIAELVHENALLCQELDRRRRADCYRGLA